MNTVPPSHFEGTRGHKGNNTVQELVAAENGAGLLTKPTQKPEGPGMLGVALWVRLLGTEQGGL